jgi:rSAM/selenodomain-associated transferase 2
MISVVIPTWNEEANLPRTIGAVRQNSVSCELIAVDRGSTDKTSDVATRLGAQVIDSAVLQRAAQMNLGARHATGDILLFLHADTLLPPEGLDCIQRALQSSKVGGGGFARRFDSRSIFLRLTCLLAEFRNRTIGWFLGDQAIFVRRDLFSQLGEFRAMDRFEDLDFSRRLAAVSKLVTLRPRVISSARRFHREGPVARTVSDFLLTMAYWRQVVGGQPENVQERSVRKV